MGPSLSLVGGRYQVREEDIACWDGDEDVMIVVLRRDTGARPPRNDDQAWGSRWRLRLGEADLLSGPFAIGIPISPAPPRHPTLGTFTWPDGRSGFVFRPGPDTDGLASFARAVLRLREHCGPRGLVCPRWSEERYRGWRAGCCGAVDLKPRGWPAGGPQPGAITVVLEGKRFGPHGVSVSLETSGAPLERTGIAVGRTAIVAASLETVVMRIPAHSSSWIQRIHARLGRWSVVVAGALTPEEIDGLGLRMFRPQLDRVPRRETWFGWRER